MLQAMLRSDQLLRSSYMLWFQLPALPEAAFRPPLDALTRRSLERTGLPADAAARYVAFLAEPGAARAALNWYRAIPFSPPLSGPVRVPTLYVHAGADPFLGPDAARRTGWQVHAPYRFVRLAGASHWLPEENPGDIAALLLEHFADATR
jgi:pimeloyl-ACP methyl ester carboxylesterase